MVVTLAVFQDEMSSLKVAYDEQYTPSVVVSSPLWLLTWQMPS